jgi:CheY-like chemotaxis protein
VCHFFQINGTGKIWVVETGGRLRLAIGEQSTLWSDHRRWQGASSRHAGQAGPTATTMITVSGAAVFERAFMSPASFPYRILVVEDDPLLREMAQLLLESKQYEVLTAADGFEGLSALKRSLPDVIISDLRMPNMNGFEFLSVVRRRFSSIPVIVISGEFTGLTVPESVLADAFFPKGGYRPEDLFAKIEDFLCELPTRPKVGKPTKAAIWIQNSTESVVVTCTECLRTFPVASAPNGVNQVECDFCSCLIRFEIVGTLLSPIEQGQ